MVAEGPKLAHQQQWVKKPANGHPGTITLNLKSTPTLCLTELPSCPHASSGCLQLQTCNGGASQLFTIKTVKGGFELLNNGKCLDIYSNGKVDGSPIDVWGCDSPQEDNQRWTWDEQTSTIASFEVIQKHLPFVITVCTKGKLGNETGY